MGAGSRSLAVRVRSHPEFIQAVSALTGDLIPVPGGVLIRGTDGSIVGAVGVSGHIPDDDEDCAVHAIAAVGFTPDPGTDPGSPNTQPMEHQ